MIQGSLAGTTASDAGNPPLGEAWFYLVTAKNRIGEEGTKGNQTGGATTIAVRHPGVSRSVSRAEATP